jgi:hypothetical protein
VTPELLDFAGENIGSMPRRRWLPWLLGWMAILVVLAWALLGGRVRRRNGGHLPVGNDPRADSPEAEAAEGSKTLMCASVR